uniref:Uncharacterized protein n=1 Tax=Anguilla anguilla TaxID=7936 RepID=A0A0E9TWL7_ANGAN
MLRWSTGRRQSKETILKILPDCHNLSCTRLCGLLTC